MAALRISHKSERAYLTDAINVYFTNNDQASAKWKSWLEYLLQEIQTEKTTIEVEETNNYVNDFFEMVLGAYLKDEFRRARNSPLVLNGFSYVNQGNFLNGWKIQN